MSETIKTPKPDRRAFSRDYGTYRIKGDPKRTKYILINSWRDRDLHRTTWRIMDEEGRTVEIDCKDVVPYNSDER